MKKRFVIDPVERIQALLAESEIAVQDKFMEAVMRTRDGLVLRQVAAMLESGRYEEAVRLLDPIGVQLASEVNAVFIVSGRDTADFLSGALREPVDFDMTHPGANVAMREDRLRLITNFTQGQRDATRAAIVHGIQTGANPKQQALNFKNSIGLTEKQVQAVINYRNLLETGSAEALDRQLRDKRFDSTVRRAKKDKVPLTQDQINRMVARYHEKSILFRAETIGRSEALRAVHTAVHEAYQQAVEAGHLQEEQLEREWHVGSADRLRASHSAMRGQKRGLNEPFLSGNGNMLMHPGDQSAPADDTINCRCAVSHRIKGI